MINNFYDVIAWQKGHRLAVSVYKITKSFPVDERYGLTQQLRRASSSITANLSEGFERYHFKDKIRFYYQARGSTGEVHNFFFLARDLGYITNSDFMELANKVTEVRKIVNGLIKATGPAK